MKFDLSVIEEMHEAHQATFKRLCDKAELEVKKTSVTFSEEQIKKASEDPGFAKGFPMFAAAYGKASKSSKKPDKKSSSDKSVKKDKTEDKPQD